MPLTLAPIGKEVTIKKMLMEEKTKRHLENLGLLPNAVIVPMSDAAGNLIIKVRDGRLAINKGVAMKIFVV